MPAEVKDLKPNIVSVMASKYMLSPDKFVTMVKKTCGLEAATEEEFHLFLITANKYDLDPLVRNLYAFRRPQGGLQFIMGYDGWITIANRHPAFRGISHKPQWDVQGKEMVAVTAIVKKQYPDSSTGDIEFTAYMKEWRRPTETWNKQPMHMLQLRATCQCIRLAFNLTGIMEEDEAERYFDLIKENQKEIKQAGTTPLDSAGDIPGEPERDEALHEFAAKVGAKVILHPDNEPAAPELEPEPEPKDEFINLDQQHNLEDLITFYGWSHRVIPEVIQEHAGCPIDQILVSQFEAIAKKIAKTGEARKKTKK